jgi:hypothetical protein
MRRWLSRDVVGLLTAPAGIAGLGGLGTVGGVGPAGGLGVSGGGVSGNGVGGGAVGGAGAGAGAGAGERRVPRFASRSMIRSVRLHQPAAGIVESTVVVQDGTRVRAVALRFEQAAPVAQERQSPGRHERQERQGRPVGFDWLCTALQFN